MNQITIGELLKEEDIKSLLAFVENNKKRQTRTHNIIMSWLDSNPQVTERFRQKEILKAYGAYLFEHYLRL